ncbi:MAG: hypothetical protein ACW98F_18805, partial [Candidatus Hodarchaeales archaeon]|jgi:hypothetical protein
MGYEVYRYGVESLVPNFVNRLSRKEGNIAEKIRMMPDFIIYLNDTVFFIEVKYRWDGYFNLKQFCKEKGVEKYPYPDSYIVLVSKNRITIQKARKLWEGEEFVYFPEIKEMKLNTDIIHQCLDFIKKVFENL